MNGKQPVTFQCPYELYLWLKEQGNQTQTIIEALEEKRRSK